MTRTTSPFYLEWVKHENGVYTPTNQINPFGVNLLAVRRKGTSLENHGNIQDISSNFDEFDLYSGLLLQAVEAGAWTDPDLVQPEHNVTLNIAPEGVSIMFGTGNQFSNTETGYDDWNLLLEHGGYNYGETAPEPYNDIKLINGQVAPDVGNDIYLKWKPSDENALTNLSDAYGLPMHFRIKPNMANLGYETVTLESDGKDYIEIPAEDVIDYGINSELNAVNYVIVKIDQRLFQPYFTNNWQGFGIKGFHADVNARWIEAFRDINEGDNVYLNAITGGIPSMQYDIAVSLEDMVVSLSESTFSSLPIMGVGFSLYLNTSDTWVHPGWGMPDYTEYGSRHVLGDFNQSDRVGDGHEEGFINIKTGIAYAENLNLDLTPIVTEISGDNNFFNQEVMADEVALIDFEDGDVADSVATINMSIYFENFEGVVEIMVFDRQDFSAEGEPLNDNAISLLPTLEDIGFNYIANAANYGNVMFAEGSWESPIFENITTSGILVDISPNQIVNVKSLYHGQEVGEDSFTIYCRHVSISDNMPQHLIDEFNALPESAKWFEIDTFNMTVVGTTDEDDDGDTGQIGDDDTDDDDTIYEDPDTGDNYDPSSHTIANPASVLFHIAEQELGYNSGLNLDKIDEARDIHDNWGWAFSLAETTDAKKLFNELSKSCKSIPIFCNDRFSFFNLKTTYRGGSQYYTDGTKEDVFTIKQEDVIDYRFERTEIEDIKTQIDYKYKIDYGLGNFVESETIKSDDTYIYGVTMKYGDIGNFDPADPTHYINYYGLKYTAGQPLNHEDTTEVFEDEYIRQVGSAKLSGEFMLGWNYNTHNKVKLTLPLKYYNLELGDLIEFDKMILGKKLYGEKYVLDEKGDMPIRCGQYILPLFIINDVKKELDRLEIEATQLHHIGSQHLYWKNWIYPSVSEILYEAGGGILGDIDGDGFLTVLDLVAVVDMVLSQEYNQLADMDGDGQVTVLDIVMLIDTVLIQSDDRVDGRGDVGATVGTINYGNGEVFFESNGDVAVFEIMYNGNFKAVNCLGEGWSMKARNNRMIIWSTGVRPVGERLFNYIGELDILSAKFINWQGEAYRPNIITLDKTSWNKSNNNWGSDGRKPEETQNRKIIHKRIEKTKV